MGVLDYCIEDIKYRIEACEAVDKEENNFNKKVAEFRAFIFSVGSILDIIRNNVFEDYEKNDSQPAKIKHFSDIYSIKKDKIQDEFDKYLNDKYTDQQKQQIRTTVESLGKILSNKKYPFPASKNPSGLMFKGEAGVKKFGLWDIYNSLKHSCYPSESLCITFTNDILGEKHEMLLYIFDGKGKYYLPIWGGWVVPVGAEEYAKDKENPFITLIKTIGNDMIDNLKVLNEILAIKK
ncbi:MAG TPA: hypothetical protein PK894_07445 [Defluviitoga sp.]|nr:hypothetical protein [Defluviitoga sp.]